MAITYECNHWSYGIIKTGKCACILLIILNCMTTALIGQSTESYMDVKSFATTPQTTVTSNTETNLSKKLDKGKINPRRVHSASIGRYNVALPYHFFLNDSLLPGQLFAVQGRIKDNANRFSINLTSGTPDNSSNEIPFHISVRFDEEELVFNTFTMGEWGKEERIANPWKKGDEYDIRIRAHQNKFTIFSFWKEIKAYSHRVPLWVSNFFIDGDVSIERFFCQRLTYPNPLEMDIELYHNIMTAMSGNMILIIGIPDERGKGFYIHFNSNDNIPLNFDFEEEKFVINRTIFGDKDDCNESEEHEFRIQKGVAFDFKIIDKEFSYLIFLNDQFITELLKCVLSQLDIVKIGGDVKITAIEYY